MFHTNVKLPERILSATCWYGVRSPWSGRAVLSAAADAKEGAAVVSKPIMIRKDYVGI